MTKAEFKKLVENGPVILDGATAVSYTHLDVYKRQTLEKRKEQ